MNDLRQHAPATLRNRDLMLGILRDVLPTEGVILEIASGSGEHVVHFARSLPNLVFQPSDRELEAWRASRRGCRRHASRMCSPQWSWTSRSRLGQSLRPMESSASTWSTFPRGRRRSDCSRVRRRSFLRGRRSISMGHTNAKELQAAVCRRWSAVPARARARPPSPDLGESLPLVERTFLQPLR